MIVEDADGVMYEQKEAGMMCSKGMRKDNEIKSADECKEAAELLGLDWGETWNKPNDFPACFFSSDLFQREVYFNENPNPARTNDNPSYSAICMIGIEPEGETQGKSNHIWNK